jgi:pantoate--beta-alanine ligase
LTRVWNSVADWLARRQELTNHSIGFVPTMGALHPGHGALIERCRRENDILVVSIFVNPTQFNDPKDLERYPRTLDRDLEFLKNLQTDEILIPSATDLYPNGYEFQVETKSSCQVMEGVYRPGFLQGVLTVVLKLLNIVRPDRAYFGEKDYQQLKAISDMVQDFFLPTTIVACPTVREESGLAESSRNIRLTTGSRDKAAFLFRVLSTARNAAEGRTMLEAKGFTVDYFEEHWGRRFAAVFLDGVRLIDNVPITGTDPSPFSDPDSKYASCTRYRQ